MIGARTAAGSPAIAFLWIVPTAVLAGGLAAMWPAAAAILVATAVGMALLALGRTTTKVFLVVLSLVLCGYAFAGRGFAYIGVAPVYVGELVLALGLFALITAFPMRRLGLGQVLLLVFMAWGAIRTLPYVGTYGEDALRDGVLWGYASFALALSLLVTPGHIDRIVRLYGLIIPLFIAWVPILALIRHSAPEVLPLLPGSGVPIPFFKPGDLAVHLAGAAAFLLAGLFAAPGWRRLIQPVLWAMWLVGFVIISALSRGGMLAMASVSSLLLFVRAPGRWSGAILVGLLLFGLAGMINLRADLGGRREISVTQLLENVQSIVGESDDPALADTRRWREDWWDSIIGYTITGPNFWQGKGFGINLAVDDGVPAPDESLRSPHNAHMTILARAGVPGLALWLAVQAVFAVTLVRASLRASRSGQRYWLAVIGWIFVYWLAALVNMTFDVYLEGPQGGIFFWSVMGLGFAVASFVQDGRVPELDGATLGAVTQADTARYRRHPEARTTA